MPGLRALTLPAVIWVLLAVPVSAGGEDPAPPAPSHISESLLREALSTLECHRLLAELCRTAPHRLSGSKGYDDAVQWAQKSMAQAGLTNIRLEPVMVPHWERGAVEVLELLGKGGDATPLPVLALGGSVATPTGGVVAEVLEVKSIEELKQREAEVKGRIVFFNRAMDPTLLSPGAAYGGAVQQRTRGPAEAAKLGAVAAVVRSMTQSLDDIPHTGVTIFPENGPRIPAVAVSTRGAERIAAMLKDGPAVRLKLELACRWHEDRPSANVVGEIVGSEKPEEIIVVGAHLDAWDVGQGAHDDGAGCCQAIEAARLIRKLGLRPKRTVRVVLFANEENGLRGGRAYALAHARELSRHVMAIESDAGGFTPRGFGSNANPAALAILQEIAEPLSSIGADRVSRGGGGADISPMGASGVVLVGFKPDTQRYFDLHHTALDTIDAVNPRELCLGAACIATLAYGVASRDEILPRNPVKSD